MFTAKSILMLTAISTLAIGNYCIGQSNFGEYDDEASNHNWQRRAIHHYYDLAMSPNGYSQQSAVLNNLTNQLYSFEKRAASNHDTQSYDSNNNLAYMISPISEQLIPLGSYPGQDSRREGRLVLSSSSGETAKAGFLPSTITSFLGNNNMKVPLNRALDGCRNMQSSVQIERDSRDSISGIILKTCRGIVTLNRCDGFCSSAVQPSTQSQFGIVKVSNNFSFSNYLDRVDSLTRQRFAISHAPALPLLQRNIAKTQINSSCRMLFHNFGAYLERLYGHYGRGANRLSMSPVQVDKRC